MQEPLTDLLPGPDTGPEQDDEAFQQVRERVQALITAARGLSDTCADLADALRPVPGHELDDPLVAAFGRLRAERTAALLDEAASAARGTLGLLHSAYGALDRVTLPTPRSGASTWPDAFVEVPPRAFAVEDEVGPPTPWAPPTGAPPAAIGSEAGEGGLRTDVTDLPVDATSGAGSDEGLRAWAPDVGGGRPEPDGSSGPGPDGIPGSAEPATAGPAGAGVALSAGAVDRDPARDGGPDSGPNPAVEPSRPDGTGPTPEVDTAGTAPDLTARAEAPGPVTRSGTARDLAADTTGQGPATRSGTAPDLATDTTGQGPATRSGTAPDLATDTTGQGLEAGPAPHGLAVDAAPPGPATGVPAIGTVADATTAPDLLTDTAPRDAAADSGTAGGRPVDGAPQGPVADVGDPEPAVGSSLIAGDPRTGTAHESADGPTTEVADPAGTREPTVATAPRPGTEPVHGMDTGTVISGTATVPAAGAPVQEEPDPDRDEAEDADLEGLRTWATSSVGIPAQRRGGGSGRPGWSGGEPGEDDRRRASDETDVAVQRDGTHRPGPAHQLDPAHQLGDAGQADDASQPGHTSQLNGPDQPDDANQPDDTNRVGDTGQADDADQPEDANRTDDAGQLNDAGQLDPGQLDDPGRVDGASPLDDADRTDDVSQLDTDRRGVVDQAADAHRIDDDHRADHAEQPDGLDEPVSAREPDGASVEDTDADDSARITSAALAGWIVVDPDDADDPGRPIRPDAFGPAAPVFAAATAPDRLDARIPLDDDPTEQAVPTPEGLRTGEWTEQLLSGSPFGDVRGVPEPAHLDDGPGWHGDTVSAEPRSLSLVPPVPEGPETIPPTWRDDRTTAPADPWAEPSTNPWGDDPLAGADLSGAATFARVERPVWTAEPVPGSSVAGDGLAVFPIGAANETVDPAPTVPMDEPAAAVISRQVEAARRHLQAALVVANGPSAPQRLGALLSAIEQVLTAVTDLARETRGVLESGLADRTFPGEARFLCSPPWEGTQLVGRDAYGDDAASPAGLAKLLRALGYEAHSSTSSAGVAGVQIRAERYTMHVALVEPVGGGRQRWSGALEWVDSTGAPRTWAETLGPVELEDEELARRVDELLRRSVGG